MAAEPDFTQFCNLLPPDSYWGDPVTPAMVGHIATAHAASLEAEVARLREALRKADDALSIIGEQDPVENMLDPQWAARIAIATRAELP